MAKLTHTASLLNLLLRYDADTGKLFWRQRPIVFFRGKTLRQQEVGAIKWNATYADREAFTHKNDRGYCVGSLFRKQYKAHRIIWKMVHHEEPNEIDHINMNRSDNRLCNLRSVSRAENCAHFTGPPIGKRWQDIRKTRAG